MTIKLNNFNSLPLLFLFGLFSIAFTQDSIEIYSSQDSVIVEAERYKKIPHTTSITTKTNLPLFQSPAHVGVVTEAMIKNQNNTVLADALNNVSGVNPQTGLGIFDYFLIRGFNSLDNGLILADGVKEPGVPVYNLYNIEQVEVLKGPGAFLYGGNPLSGTINLSRKKPLFQNFMNFSASGGSFNSYRSTADLGFSFPQKGLAARINGLWQKSDNYRNDKENLVYAVNPAITWQVSPETEIYTNLEYARNEFSPDAGLPIKFDPATNTLNQVPAVSRKTSYQTPFDKSEQTLVRFRAGFNHQFSTTVSLSNKFYFTDLDWKSTGTILNGAFPTQTGSYIVSRSFQQLDDRQKLLGNKLELRFSFGGKNFGNEILTGLEVNRLTDVFTIDVMPQLPIISLKNPVEITEQSSITTFPFQFGDTKSTVAAPYLLNVVSLQKKLKLFLGGRYDLISFKDKLNQSDRDYNKFSPMTGLTWLPVKSLALYGNWTTAFAPPSSRVTGEPKAEESRQYEFGIRRNWVDGKIRTSIAFFELEKENISIPDRTGLSRQIGNQKSRGIEFEVQGQMTEKCASIFSYTFTEADLTRFSELVTIGMDELGQPVQIAVDRSGNTAPFAPKHILNFWHTRDIGSHFGFGAGIRYVSEQFISEDNIFAIDDYFTIDASVYYQIRNWRWRLNFRNLTDSEYEMRGFAASSVIPAAPFAIYGGFEINY